MWIQLVAANLEETLQELDQSADEKEDSLETMVAGAGLQVMKDVVLFRKAYASLRELDKMRKAYEELLEIKWNHSGYESAVETIVGSE